MAVQLDIPLPEITTENFERSWTRFTLVAAAKGWDEGRQLVIIPTLLRGKLLDFYLDLKDTEKNTLQAVKDNLVKRTELKKNALAATRDFQGQTQGAQERARDFAADLKKMFEQAYPDEAETSAVLAQKFMTGLRPSIGRQVLLRGRPDNLEEAIKQAAEVEDALEFNSEEEQDNILAVQKSNESKIEDSEEVSRLRRLVEGE